MTPSEFLEKWSGSAAAERSNAQSFVLDLCQVLNVDPPHAATSDADRDAYVFEKPVTVPHEGRQQSIGFVDLFKRGHFILEAKQGSEEGSSRLGTAKRDTPAWHIAMQDAFGQALKYARAMDAPPPFLIVTDVGYCFDLYASFDRSASYRAFPDAASSGNADLGSGFGSRNIGRAGLPGPLHIRQELHGRNAGVPPAGPAASPPPNERLAPTSVTSEF